MNYLSSRSPIKKARPALIAGAVLFLTSAMTISGLNLFDSRFGFEFLPLLVLVIWPRHANTPLSLGLVWLAGLFTEWATGDITGQWSLIYVLVWGVFRPEMRGTPFAPLGLVFVWGLICLVTTLVLFLTGYFVYGILPDLWPIGRQISLATLTLPLIVLLRRAILRRLKDYDDWG